MYIKKAKYDLFETQNMEGENNYYCMKLDIYLNPI